MVAFLTIMAVVWGVSIYFAYRGGFIEGMNQTMDKLEDDYE